MITWITENVAIGEYLDACNKENIEREKIDCVLSLRIIDDVGEPLMLMQMGVEYYKIPVGRHQGVEPIKLELKIATQMLKLLVERHNKVLVHCTAGIDRAPFVVSQYLVDQGIAQTIAEAYSIIKKCRPLIIEHYEWV